MFCDKAGAHVCGTVHVTHICGTVHLTMISDGWYCMALEYVCDDAKQNVATMNGGAVIQVSCFHAISDRSSFVSVACSGFRCCLFIGLSGEQVI